MSAMHRLLVSAIGVTCTATLALAPAPAALAAAAPAPAAAPSAGVPGSTQSLPLAPLPSRDRSGSQGGTSAVGLPARDVKPFSLIGVAWDDPGAELQGRVRVRTRSLATGQWSSWRELSAHSGHVPDAAPTDRKGARPHRGSTAPLWVGPSDGVQVRVEPRARRGGDGGRRAGTAAALPAGMTLELVDPGEDPAATRRERAAGTRAMPRPHQARPAAVTGRAATDTPSAATPLPSGGPSSTTSPTPTETTTPTDSPTPTNSPTPPKPDPTGGRHSVTAPRPPIVIRSGWGADESLRERDFLYTKALKAAFVHHTAGTNAYSCAEAPSIIRGIYRYHVLTNGWRDIGYNFLVDKCGTIYEGRAGGVREPVMGAHTLGFNERTTGIALLGSHGTTAPSKAAVEAISLLTAWKLDLSGVNAAGTTTLVSGGGTYPKGKKVKFHTISGHRDGYTTDCPGDRLYQELGTIRETAARLQGR